MKKVKKNQAAAAMARLRWKGVSKAERSVLARRAISARWPPNPERFESYDDYVVARKEWEFRQRMRAIQTLDKETA